MQLARTLPDVVYTCATGQDTFQTTRHVARVGIVHVTCKTWRQIQPAPFQKNVMAVSTTRVAVSSPVTRTTQREAQSGTTRVQLPGGSAAGNQGSCRDVPLEEHSAQNVQLPKVCRGGAKHDSDCVEQVGDAPTVEHSARWSQWWIVSQDLIVVRSRDVESMNTGCAIQINRARGRNAMVVMRA